MGNNSYSYKFFLNIRLQKYKKYMSCLLENIFFILIKFQFLTIIVPVGLNKKQISECFLI